MIGDLTTLATVKAWLGLSGLPIATITRANPAVLALTMRPPTALLSGVTYSLDGVTGMAALNGDHVITVIDPQTFSIPVDTTSLGTYSGGGVVGIADPLITRMITACSAYVQSWLNRSIAVQTYSEIRNGIGGNRLMLANYPVVSVASVTIDGIAIPPRPALGSSTTAVGYTFTGGPGGYVFDEASIMLSGYSFCRGFQNIAVTYDAGYATTPADIEQAVVDIIGDWFKYRERIGRTSEGIEGQTTAFVNTPIPVRAQGVLNQYRRVVPFGP